jgi:hypothetical protein
MRQLWQDVEMIASLEEFLRAELPDRQKRLDAIRGTIGEVLASFGNMFDATRKQWPYKVSESHPAEALKLSHSTNAMVLFMLRIMNGSLIPEAWDRVALIPPLLARAGQGFGLSKSLTDAMEATKTTLTQALEKDARTSSGTFGEDDPMTLCWLLESGVALTDAHLVRVEAFVKETLANPNQYRLNPNGNSAAPHAFPMLRVAQLERKLRVMGRSKCSLAEAQEWFSSRLHLHLSYSAIPDSTFDAPELIFALEGLLVCDPHTDGLGRVVGRAVEVLRDKQQHNPNLRPYRPFVSDEKGLALLPLTIEVFNSLLRVVERLAGSDIHQLGQVTQIFDRYADWVLGQRQDVHINEKIKVSGWNSEHTHTAGLLHVWETSQVLVFLAHYARWLNVGLQSSAIASANFTVGSHKIKGFMPKSVAQCAAAESAAKHPAYRQIFDRFISPRMPAAVGEPQFSALLYGPPGTGKSTFAEFLAAHLGWELITITPSDFIVRGGEMVEARAKAIFRALDLLEEKVVLFDEIDRLILDRESDGYSNQADIFQFMTPSMLPKIARLRERRACIFLVGTNYAERIDPAIKREGRIDTQILVQLPDLRKRRELICMQLASRAVSIYRSRNRKTGELTSAELTEAAKAYGLESIAELALARSHSVAHVAPSNETSLELVARETVLLNIKSITQRAAAAFAAHDSVADGLAQLMTDVTYPAGDVTLESYKSRMAKRDGFRAPTEEYQSLVELVTEAGKPSAP